MLSAECMTTDKCNKCTSNNYLFKKQESDGFVKAQKVSL